MDKSLESKNQRQASLAQQTDSWMTGCVTRSHSTAAHTLKGASINVGEAASARQKQAKKRGLRAVNEHLEPVINAAMATQVVFSGARKRDESTATGPQVDHAVAAADLPAPRATHSEWRSENSPAPPRHGS